MFATLSGPGRRAFFKAKFSAYLVPPHAILHHSNSLIKGNAEVSAGQIVSMGNLTITQACLMKVKDLVQADSVSKRKVRHHWGCEHTNNTSHAKL
jgi:hypothetical protein